MAYHVRLDNFEGPLDLLLHLVEKEEVDIYDIPIAQIAEQYLAHVKKMQELDLDVTSEFLVMAAQLMDIKTKMLFPAAADEEEADVEEADQDPREELVRRLLEYRRFKQAAQELKEKEEETLQRFPRLIHEALELDPSSPLLEGVSLEDLVRAFQQVMEANASDEERPREISRQQFTVEEKAEQLISQLERSRGKMLFAESFAPGAARLEIVVTFLALLELIRLGRVRVRQDAPFGGITLYLEAA